VAHLRLATALLAVATGAAVRAAPGLEAAPAPDGDFRAIVQPGQPMRLEAPPPAATRTARVAEPCALPLVQDRAGTPSSTCMTCHDGSKAVDARTGHRYDIEYRSAFDPDLRPNPEQFNPKVVLSNGRVTCLTCHDPASSIEFHLAGRLDGPVKQRMCVACHPRV
jgi:hypothetical protein